MSEDEGTDYLKAFESTFKGHGYADRRQTRERLKAERRAGLTPKQRNRPKAPPKVQINFRATEEFKAELEGLAKALDLTVTDVITEAVAAFKKARAKKETTA